MTDKQDRVDLATRIFAEYGSEIRDIIRQQVTGKEEEDEVYQNLFLSLVCHPPAQLPANVPAYLSTVIRNDVIDAVRQRRSRQQVVSNYALRRVRDDFEDAPDERVTQAEEVQRITGLVGKLLPAREAQVLIERYLNGRSTSDIATQMQVTERTVSHYACVGLKRIRDVLFGSPPDAGDVFPEPGTEKGAME